MATFFVSVFVDTRFFVREKVDAVAMYHAWLQMATKYKALHRFGVVYKCNYRGCYRYYDSHGNELH